MPLLGPSTPSSFVSEVSHALESAKDEAKLEEEVHKDSKCVFI